jgi:hypothetical protein
MIGKVSSSLALSLLNILSVSQSLELGPGYSHAIEGISQPTKIEEHYADT